MVERVPGEGHLTEALETQPTPAFAGHLSLPPSGSPDCDSQKASKPLMSTLQMSLQEPRAGPRETESGSGGANGRYPSQYSRMQIADIRMDASGGQGKKLRTRSVEEDTKTGSLL